MMDVDTIKIINKVILDEILMEEIEKQMNNDNSNSLTIQNDPLISQNQNEAIQISTTSRL